MNNKTISLLNLLILCFTLNTVQAANTTISATKYMPLGLDVVQKVLTNVGLHKHDGKTANAGSWHAAAAATGIARNIAHMFNNNPNNGDMIALGSSLTTNIIDLIVHLQNVKNTNTYQEAEIYTLSGIRSTQVLELLIHSLKTFAPTEALQKTDVQTALQNAHATLEALEQLLLSNCYELSSENKMMLQALLVLSMVINTGNACYYGTKSSSEKTAESEIELNQEVRQSGRNYLERHVPSDYDAKTIRVKNNAHAACAANRFYLGSNQTPYNQRAVRFGTFKPSDDRVTEVRNTLQNLGLLNQNDVITARQAARFDVFRKWITHDGNHTTPEAVTRAAFARAVEVQAEAVQLGLETLG